MKNLIEMTDKEAKLIVEEAIKCGYMDYWKDIGRDYYYYEDCQLCYKDYRIDTFMGEGLLVFISNSADKDDLVLIENEKLYDELSEMFDLWMRL